MITSNDNRGKKNTYRTLNEKWKSRHYIANNYKTAES